MENLNSIILNDKGEEFLNYIPFLTEEEFPSILADSIKAGALTITEIILSSGLVDIALEEAKGEYHYLLYIMASDFTEEIKLNLLRLLISYGADINLIYGLNGNNTIMLAVKDGNVNIVRELLQYSGIDLTHRNIFNEDVNKLAYDIEDPNIRFQMISLLGLNVSPTIHQESIFPNEILDKIIENCDIETAIVLHDVSIGIRYLTSQHVKLNDPNCFSVNEAYLRHLYGYDYKLHDMSLSSYINPNNVLTKGKLIFYKNILGKYLNEDKKIEIQESLSSYINNREPNWYDIFYCLHLLEFPHLSEHNYELFTNSLSISNKSRLMLENVSTKYIPALFALWNLYEDDNSLYVNRNILCKYKDDIIISDFSEALMKCDLDLRIWDYISGKEELFPNIYQMLLKRGIYKPNEVRIVQLKPMLNYPISSSTLERIISFDISSYFEEKYLNRGDKIVLDKQLLNLIVKYKPYNIVDIIDRQWIIKYNYIIQEATSYVNKKFVADNVDMDILNISEQDAQFLIDHNLLSNIDRIFLINRYPNLNIDPNEEVFMLQVDYVINIMDAIDTMDIVKD